MTKGTKELINTLVSWNFEIHESTIKNFIKQFKDQIKNFKSIYQKTYWYEEDDGFMSSYDKYLFIVRLNDGTEYEIKNLYRNN